MGWRRANMSLGSHDWRMRRARSRIQRSARRALALNRRGEVRTDGLRLRTLRNRLEIEWGARDVHPWDRDLSACDRAQLFAEQCLEDVNSVLERLFENLPEIDVIEFKVIALDSSCSILSGVVTRSAVDEADAKSAGMRLKQLGVRFRLVNWQFQPLT